MYVTRTTYFTGTALSTTTAASYTGGTAPGIVVVQLPQPYVTITQAFTPSGSATAARTSTISPSATSSGIIIVHQPLPTFGCARYGYRIQKNILYSLDLASGDSAQLATVDSGGLEVNSRTLLSATKASFAPSTFAMTWLTFALSRVQHRGQLPVRQHSRS